MKTSSATQLSPKLAKYYDRLAKRHVIRTNPDYEKLVVPNGNSRDRIHRWFHLKEAFSKDLLNRIVKDLALPEKLHVLDPLSGCGTTGVAVADAVRERNLKSATFAGYECNPFLQLVSRSKLNALLSPTRTFMDVAAKAAAAVVRGRVEPGPVPPLSTFSNRSYFGAENLNRLLMLKEAIVQCARDGATTQDVDLAMMCLGSIVEGASSLRRDGRALRYAPERSPVDPVIAFLAKASQVDEDMYAAPVPVRGSVRLGDGRFCRPNSVRKESIDLAMFSPPYPNNIDYTEVYKLEAWLLGLIQDHEAFAAQRLRTLYSHPSLKREPRADTDANEATELAAPIIDTVPDDRYANARTAMINGYTVDMLDTLRSLYRLVRPGGHVACVVGNPLHGRGKDAFVIATDLIVAELAETVGFNVLTIEIARRPIRRRGQSKYLRESVVFARRAD